MSIGEQPNDTNDIYPNVNSSDDIYHSNEDEYREILVQAQGGDSAAYYSLLRNSNRDPVAAHHLGLYYDMSEEAANHFADALFRQSLTHREAIEDVLNSFSGDSDGFHFFTNDDISLMRYHEAEDLERILTRQMRAGDGVAAYALGLFAGMHENRANDFAGLIAQGHGPEEAMQLSRSIPDDLHDNQAALRKLEEHNKNVAEKERARKEAADAMTSTQRVVSEYLQNNVGACAICLTSFSDLDFSSEDQQIVFTPCKNQCSMCKGCYDEHMKDGRLLTRITLHDDLIYKCMTCNTTQILEPSALLVRNRSLEDAITFAKAASVSANQDHVRELLHRALIEELHDTTHAQSSTEDDLRGQISDLSSRLDDEYSTSYESQMQINELKSQLESEQAAVVEERARVQELEKQLQAANDLNTSNKTRLMELEEKYSRAKDEFANLTQVVDNVHKAMGLASSSSSAPAAAAASVPAPAPAPAPASSSRSTGKRRRNPEPVENGMNTTDLQILTDDDKDDDDDDDDCLHPSKDWLDTDPNTWTMKQLISQAHSEWKRIKRMGVNNLAVLRYELVGGVDMSDWDPRDQEFDTKEKLRRDILVAYATGCANNDFSRRKIRLEQMAKDERREAKGTSSSSQAAAASAPKKKKKKNKQQRSSSSTSKAARSSSPEVIVVSDDDEDQDPEVAEENAAYELVIGSSSSSSSSRAR